MNTEKGFTLLEVMVVATITVFISGLLIQSFSRLRVDLSQTQITIMDAIRDAQFQAVSGALYEETYRCGYGIHFDPTGYAIYAGPDSAVSDCSLLVDRNYHDGDVIIRQELLSNSSLEIVPGLDIFFEPPNPTTYINNSSAIGVITNIIVRRKDADCPSSNCKMITVSTSGQIQSQ